MRAAIRRAPDDLQARLVYADYLQTRGDPLGELIALQATRLESSGTARLEAAARAETAHLHQHRKQFLGELDLTCVALRWEMGFIREAYFKQAADPKQLASLLALPTAEFLRFLGLRGLDEQWEGHARALEKADPPLEGLYLRGRNLQGLSVEVEGLKRLWVIAQRAPELRIPTGVEWLRLDLRDSLTLVQAADLSRVQVLHLALRGAPTADVLAWLDEVELPSVTHVGLTHTIGTDAVVQVLASRPWFRQLTSLDVSYGNLTVEGARTFAEAIREAPSLKIVDIDHNDLETSVRELNNLHTDIHYGIQRTGDGNTRSQMWARAVRNREEYERPDGNFVTPIGVGDAIRKIARKQSLEAALELFDRVPAMSPYRQGAHGSHLVQRVLKLLAKGDLYESILRVCRETPWEARTAHIVRYEVLAHLVAGRFREALTRVHGGEDDAELSVMRAWARAALGAQDALDQLEYAATTGSVDRWSHYAYAAAVQDYDAEVAAKHLRAALDDPLPTIPAIPCAAVSRRVFAQTARCLRLLVDD